MDYYNPGFAKELRALQRRYLDDADKLGPVAHRFVENALRLAGPLLQGTDVRHIKWQNGPEISDSGKTSRSEFSRLPPPLKRNIPSRLFGPMRVSAPGCRKA